MVGLLDPEKITDSTETHHHQHHSSSSSSSSSLNRLKGMVMDDDKYEKTKKQDCNARIKIISIIVILCVLGALFNTRIIKGRENKENALLHAADVSYEEELEHHRLIQEKTWEYEVEKLDREVRKIKARLPPDKFMETDKAALAVTAKLQDATRKLLNARYGPNEPYRVKLLLEFQPTIPDYERNGKDGIIVIELAPSQLVPHSIHMFLEMARKWKGGAFHRIANHVLQVMVKGRHLNSLAFQEYSPDFPHVKGTVGYAGRPSGPAWYVSIMDNSKVHGPGTQQQHNPYEADSCFGKVVRGFDDVVQRIRKVPGRGFVNDPKKHVLIKEMKILIPTSDVASSDVGNERVQVEDGYVEWVPKGKTTSQS